MRLELSPLITSAKGPWGGKRGYLLKTNKLGHTYLVKRRQGLGAAEQANTKVQWAQYTYSRLDAMWWRLTPEQRIEWARCASDAAPPRWSGFTYFKSLNFRRAYLDAMMLYSPPHKALSLQLYPEVLKGKGVWVRGVRKDDKPFDVDEGDEPPPAEPPCIDPDIYGCPNWMPNTPFCYQMVGFYLSLERVSFYNVKNTYFHVPYPPISPDDPDYWGWWYQPLDEWHDSTPPVHPGVPRYWIHVLPQQLVCLEGEWAVTFRIVIDDWLGQQVFNEHWTYRKLRPLLYRHPLGLDTYPSGTYTRMSPFNFRGSNPNDHRYEPRAPHPYAANTVLIYCYARTRDDYDQPDWP